MPTSRYFPSALKSKKVMMKIKAKRSSAVTPVRYNSSKMVNDIRRVATIPVQLIHRHLLHEAILETAELMVGAKSEMVRQKAADTLIRELKPTEDAVLHIDVNDGSKSVIEELRQATQALAAKQHEAILLAFRCKKLPRKDLY